MLSTSGDRNPTTGKIHFEAIFRYDGIPDVEFQNFFKSYSLADFTKLSEDRRQAALGVLLTFHEDPQENDLLDSETISARQKEVLAKYLETADPKMQAEVYRSATVTALFYDTAIAKKLFGIYFKKNPEESKSQLCGLISNTEFTYVGMNDAPAFKKLEDRSKFLSGVLLDHPELATQNCYEGSSATLSDYLKALQTNTPVAKIAIQPNLKKIEYKAPPLQDCTLKNIQRLISASVDSLATAPNGTISFLGSKMTTCKFEGKIFKVQNKLYFNSSYFGKSSQNIPLQDLSNSWGLKLSLKDPSSTPAPTTTQKKPETRASPPSSR